MSQLFKKICRLKESLNTNLNNEQAAAASHFTSNGGGNNKLNKESLRDQLEECVSVTHVACSELFDLTLLVPSAPWVRFNENIKL